MSSSSSVIRPNGQLSIPVPEKKSPSIFFTMFMHAIPFVALPICTVRSIFDSQFRDFWSISYKLYATVFSSPNERTQWYHQDAGLLAKLWTQKSASVYVDSLEYQAREGFCGSATLRCILRSFGMDATSLPPQKFGESSPPKWCPHIEEVAREHQQIDHAENEKGEKEKEAPFELRTKVVKGSVPYREFLTELEGGLAKDDVRVACNFLRSALFGFELSRWVPYHWLASLYGGHFSPILGIVETDGQADDPLVAIFDTNAKYGGVYFVPATRLYDSVAAVDVFGSKDARAIIFVEKVTKGSGT